MKTVILSNYTEPAKIDEVFSRLKKKSAEQNDLSVHERKKKLKRLAQTIMKYRFKIHDALLNDFQKPASETDISEIWPVLSEISHARRFLNNWCQPRNIASPFSMLGTSAAINYEPKGTVLIIAPWNYPFNLTLAPLVSAIAAGNTAVLKPSEITSHTAAVIEDVITEAFPPDEVAVIQGGVKESQYLLSLNFDHIYFTGSTAVGKKVMEAAAKNLTTVTLELGGKSPVIVDKTANISDAAEKILWGKLLNCGQTCIAPDYALVHEDRADEFISAAVRSIEKLYAGPINANNDYSRIVNAMHYERIIDLLEEAKNKGANIITGGEYEDRFISPTLLNNVTFSMKIMQDEIFGPILPIITFKNLDEALQKISMNPNPLAAYIFSGEEKSKTKVITELSAGSIGVNDCVIHFAHPKLPFGGIGSSGMGRAHGYYGFQAFSNVKSVLRQKTGFTTAKLLYPPYTATKQKLIDLLLKYF